MVRPGALGSRRTAQPGRLTPSPTAPVRCHRGLCVAQHFAPPPVRGGNPGPAPLTNPKGSPVNAVLTAPARRMPTLQVDAPYPETCTWPVSGIRQTVLMRRRVLFGRGQLAEHLGTKLDEVPKAIDSWDAERLLTLPEADIVDQLIDEFRIDVPILDRDKIELAPLKETYGTSYNEFGEPFKIRQNIITIMVPYSGDRAVFTLRPTAYTDSPPQGVVTEYWVALHWFTAATDPQFVRKHLDLKIDELARWLDWSRGDVAGYNQRIEQLVPWLVQGRRAALLASRNLESSLGFTVSKRPDADDYTVPLVRTKIRAKLAASPAAEPFEPEWVLADADYEEALRVLRTRQL